MIPGVDGRRIRVMPRRRWILLGFVTAVTLGGMGVTGGMAWYLRSAHYRTKCAAALSDALGLPCSIGRVVPRTRWAREFRDIVVWLPNRRGRALSCRSAVVTTEPTAADREAYTIRLVGGTCEISTRTWLREDYRGVFESGLRPGFAPGGPRRVVFSEMNVAFVRDRFRLELADAAGSVDFVDAQHGEARILCQRFNGEPMDHPVLFTARFSPHDAGIRIDRFEATLPEMPVAVTRLEALTGAALRHGRFAGRFEYGETDTARTLVIRGKCAGLDLAECTTGLVVPPWRGSCPEIRLDELRIVNGRPERLRFGGVLRDVHLSDVLAGWGISGGGGRLALDVGVADLTPGGVARFVASGELRSVALDALTRSLGWGLMTGTLNATISDLTIEDDHVRSGDLELRVADADNPPNWIEGRLLRELARRLLKLDLPAFLPARIEFSRFGVRLELRDEVLYVFGTHGERDRTILTVRLFGGDFALIHEPRRSFDLRPWFDALRARLRARARELFDRRGRKPRAPPG